MIRKSARWRFWEKEWHKLMFKNGDWDMVHRLRRAIVWDQWLGVDE